MYHSHQLNPARNHPVEHQIASYWQIPEVLGNIRPCLPQFRILCKQLAFLLDAQEDAVRTERKKRGITPVYLRVDLQRNQQFKDCKTKGWKN